MIPREAGDAIEGERFVAIGGKITKPIVIPSTSGAGPVRS